MNGRPKAVIVDMDNTLALLNGRDPHDESTVSNDRLNTILWEVLSLLLLQGYHIVVTTGRNERTRQDTINWLSKYGIPFSDLYMRPKESIESGVKLKEQWYEFAIKYKYDVLVAFDDMFQVCYMYRNKGVAAWQVNTDPFAKAKGQA